MTHAPPDERDELDASARAMLDAFAAEERIPADVHDRVWARVAADVAPAPVKWSRRALVLSGLAAAAAVALMWMGERALRAVDAGPPASQAGYERVGARPEGVAEPRAPQRPGPRERGAASAEGTAEPEATSEPEAPTLEALAPPASEPLPPREPAASRPRPDRRGSASVEPPAPEPTPTLGDTLAEENRLLSRARAELLAEHPDQALVHLDEHARRFASGVLAEERQALRAVALCEAGRASEGEAQARTFLRAHPRAALAQRVRSACLE